MLKNSKRNRKANRRGLRPGLEGLEGRVVLSTFNVNTTADTVAVNFQTGQDQNGQISLRSAIMAADAQAGTNQINLPAGTYTLSRFGSVLNNGTAGELDINANVTIQGKGATQTIIDGNLTDRVMEVLGGNVSITGVTIQHGQVRGQGGGILHNGGQLTLNSVVVANNEAFGAVGNFGGGNGGNGGNGQGGGIFNAAGLLTLTRSTITSNQAIGGNGGDGGFIIEITPPPAVVGGPGFVGGQGGAGQGGGVFNATGATVTLNGVTVSANQALGGKGGAGSIGGDASGSASGAGVGGNGGNAGNGGAAQGGGLFNLGSASVTGTVSTVSGNSAAGGSGGAGAAGGTGTGGNGANGLFFGFTPGGIGGQGIGGFGGFGGNGGIAQGGGIFNGRGANLTNTTTLAIEKNVATGGAGIGGHGGNGSHGSAPDNLGGTGGTGGHAIGGLGGNAGVSGDGQGGGLFNDIGGTVIYRAQTPSQPPAASTFNENRALGGNAASVPGGAGGNAVGGAAGLPGLDARGGNGGSANGDLVIGGPSTEAAGGNGGNAGSGEGGGLFNAGSASFTGVTVNLTFNQAVSGIGGAGGAGGNATGGASTFSIVGATAGGSASGGNGGNGGAGESGTGGGIFNAATGTVTLKPRLGAVAGSAQAQATDVITSNKALSATGGPGGAGGTATGGIGQPSSVFNGVATPGRPGVTNLVSTGVGGGIANLGTTFLDNTTIAGNTGSTGDPNIHGNKLLP